MLPGQLPAAIRPGLRAVLLGGGATPPNLLTKTEAFDNAAWTKIASSVTADATTAPNGASTADKLVENSVTNTHFVQQAVTLTANLPYTVSIYGKASERHWIKVNGWTTALRGAYFDLTNGVVGTLDAGISAQIYALPNSWYRCAVNFTYASGSPNVYCLLATADGTNNYLGDGSSGAYLWGAQLVRGSLPGPYRPVK